MVGIVGSFVRPVLLGSVLGVAVWVPVRAQDADSVAFGLMEGTDAFLLAEAIETAWTAEGVWLTRLQRPGNIPASHIGSVLGWQSRLQVQAGYVGLGFLLEKNPGEPWGPTQEASWKGPERKRMSLDIQKERWSLVLGPFRQQVGFGLVAGRSDGWAPALASPLRQPDILPRAGARIGSAGEPLPGGLSLMMHGTRGRMGLFHGHTWHTASVHQQDGAWIVGGPSGTTVFATPSAMERRRRLGISWSGWMGSLQGKRWQIATLQSLIRAESRMERDGQRLPLAFDAHRYWSTVAVALRPGAFEGAVEWAMSPGASLVEWTVRWRAAPGKGIRLGRKRQRGAARSPFGGHARFLVDWRKEDVWNAAATWRSAGHILSVIGALQSRTATTRERRQRVAISWTLRPGPTWTLSSFAVRDHDADRRWRIGTRYSAGLATPLHLDAQIQIGVRTSEGSGKRLSALQTMGARLIRSGWDLHLMALRRTGGSGSAPLYAAVPAMKHGFPVLGGSSRRWIGMARLRRHVGSRLTFEAWTRFDFSRQGRSAQWQVQCSVML